MFPLTFKPTMFWSNDIWFRLQFETQKIRMWTKSLLNDVDLSDGAPQYVHCTTGNARGTSAIERYFPRFLFRAIVGNIKLNNFQGFVKSWWKKKIYPVQEFLWLPFYILWFVINIPAFLHYINRKVCDRSQRKIVTHNFLINQGNFFFVIYKKHISNR